MILDVQREGIRGKNITLPDLNIKLSILDERINRGKLRNLKKQFISYYKSNPTSDSQNNIATLFIQFINSSIKINE